MTETDKDKSYNIIFSRLISILAGRNPFVLEIILSINKLVIVLSFLPPLQPIKFCSAGKVCDFTTLVCVSHQICHNLSLSLCYRIRRPFSEFYGGFPSAHWRPNYHQFVLLRISHRVTGEMFPSSVLVFPPLPLSLALRFCLCLSIWPSIPVFLKACHSLATHTHICADTHTSAGNERGGKLQDCVCFFFSRIIEICLDANGRSCPPKCLNISHTHTHTATQRFACEFKQITFGGTSVCPSACEFGGVCIGSSQCICH